MNRRHRNESGTEVGGARCKIVRLRRAVVVASSVLLALAAGPVGPDGLAAQERVDETRAAPADGSVEIRNMAGSITISGWDREEVRVTGTLDRGVEELAIDRSGPRTRIEVRLPGNRGGPDVSADLEIRVPRGSDVTASGVSAGISVRNVDGELDLKTVSGAVDVGSGPGPVRAESISGRVRVDGGRNGVRARSTSGRVLVRDVSGTVEASSVSGTVEVSGSTFRDVRLETVSGGVRFEGGVTRDAEVRMESMSGSLDVVVPRDVDGEFRLSSFSGSLSVGLEAAVERSEGMGAGRDAEFTLGSGSARFVLESFSGSIRVRGG